MSHLERYTSNNIQKFIRASLIIIESALLILIFRVLLIWLMPALSESGEFFSTQNMIGLALICWFGSTTLAGYHDQQAFYSLKYLLRWGVVSSCLTLCAFFSLLSYSPYLVDWSSLTTLLLVAILLSSFPLRTGYILLYRYRRLFIRNSRIMIIGNTSAANDLHSFFKKHKATTLLHMLNGETKDMNEKELLSYARVMLPQIKKTAVAEKISEIYWNLPLTGADLLEEVGEFAQNNYISFKITSGFRYLDQEGKVLGYINNQPVITLRNPPLASFTKRLLKRGFDLIFSTAVILLIFPWLLPIIAILIKLDSEGPVFFLQSRAGKKNQVFRCIKFRTMKAVRSDAAFKQATRNDPRITRVGKFLRRHNLDEFPQFFNVFLGQMSVIGPRPHPPKLDEVYEPLIKFYQYRYFIKPGISGWAQVHGYRGETKVKEKMMKRVEFDNWYIENWTLWLDFLIVIRTVFNTVNGDDQAF